VITVDVGGAPLVLRPDRLAYAPDFHALLVADAHFGKAVSFRRLGVPVPGGTTAGNLARLEAAVRETGARRIVFLGDLLHSVRAHARDTLAELRAWRARHAGLQLTLVRGNHDDHAGDPPADLGVQALDGPLPLGPWQLAHHPDPIDAGYVLAGHVHPCVHLAGRAGDRLRLPCFHFGDRVGMLPAFGDFTGMHALPREAGDRVYAICDDLVTRV
jgi:DNA ligase-associated metallophosphoesterase